MTVCYYKFFHPLIADLHVGYIYIYTGVPGSNLPMCTCISVSKHCCGHMIRSTILGVSLALDTEVAGGEMLIDM